MNNRVEGVEAYPLHWPPGRERTKYRKRADFHRKVSVPYASGNGSYLQKSALTIADSQGRLRHELSVLGAKLVVISSNLRLKMDGLPMSNQREPDDPGIAVYFQMKGHPHCLSCDKWDRAADNLAAIAKHVEAMRGQLRWGVADIATMFAGFKALPGAIITPASMTVEEAAQFIGKYGAESWQTVMHNRDTFNRAYRSAVQRLHPDRNAGVTPEDWHVLQRATEMVESHLGAEVSR